MITATNCFQCFQNISRTRYLLTPSVLSTISYTQITSFGSMAWKQYDNGPPRKMNRFQNPNRNANFSSFDGSFPRNFNNFGGPPSLFDLNLSDFNNLQPPPPPPEIPTFMNCGDLRPVHVNQLVELEGKVNRLRLGRFIELKDQFGVVQLVAPSGNTNVVNRFKNLPVDSFMSIVGYVRRRPENLVNTSLATGAIEVQVEEILRVMKVGRSERSLNQAGGKRHYSTLAMSKPKIILSLTSNEFKKTEFSDNCRQYFVNREHTCDSLRLEDVDRTVTLVGWLEGKQKLNANRKFVKLYDGHGYTQLVVDQNHLKDTLGNVGENEFLLVTGCVTCRPKGQQMMLQPNGEIELFVKEVKIIDPTATYAGPIKPRPTEIVETTESLLPAPPEKPFINQYTCRTHNCGELRTEHTNETVTLCGWLQFQRMQKFFTLRDSYGETQVIVPEHLSETVGIDRISYESILKVRGVVLARPPSMRNSRMATGDIEICLESLEILNSARSNLPMEVRGFNRAKEATRLEYRYIDLRFADMQRNLRLRSAVLMKMREYLINYAGFVEVETPTLFRRTPGGAQEFVVPTRKSGHFYSLVQSPQQYKQMLMSGAIDRYFQIARCYRDESTRPDRQPEFTQLDVELSFTDRDSIIMLIENLLKHCWPVDKAPICLPFPRMTYDQAMSTYGCDKPDMTFDMLLNDVTDVMAEYKPASDAPDDFVVYAVICSGTDKKKFSMLNNINSKLAADFDCKFVSGRIAKDPKQWANNNEFKNLSEAAALKLIESLEAKADDVIQIAYGDKNTVQNLMGKIRLSTMEFLETTKIAPPRSESPYKFLWVLDFPMFSKSESGGEQLTSTHHPFTAPHPEDAELLNDSNAHLRVRSLAYDLVLNGMEVGGGSIRIHDAQLQRTVLDNILQIDHSHLSHLIDALATGCPPHGGIALGLDRLLCFLCEAKSIRDVMAFPKSLDGRDPLSKAPVPITDAELKMYHIRVEGDAKTNESNEKILAV